MMANWWVNIYVQSTWCFGLPAAVMALLWPERKQLQQGRRPGGLGEHLQDFCAPYKPQYWFFESVEFGKKLLLVGVVPAIHGRDQAGGLVGALAALLISAAYLSIILSISPYTHKSDQFLAVCSNALLSVVILISVLLKMNSAYIAHQTAAGFDLETASKLLVASNLLVVFASVAAYAISARQAGQREDAFATRHAHNLQEPLLNSAEDDEDDIAEAGGDRELSKQVCQCCDTL
jgi:hypothetical protein